MKEAVDALRLTRRSYLSSCALGALAVLLIKPQLALAAEGVAAPPPAVDPSASGSQTIVVAGGCFWGVQGVFQHVRGVTNAVSGYAGGAKADAQYEIVSSGRTGHAESVQISFDPTIISLGRLLQIFFSVALDPTEVNRQGPDVGSQYRSVIFAADEAQAATARAYIAQLDAAKVFAAPIATQVTTGKTFYPAEGYHQNFLTEHPTYPYIVYNDLPKLANLKKLFPADYRPDPVLVAQAG